MPGKHDYEDPQSQIARLHLAWWMAILFRYSTLTCFEAPAILYFGRLVDSISLKTLSKVVHSDAAPMQQIWNDITWFRVQRLFLPTSCRRSTMAARDSMGTTVGIYDAGGRVGFGRSFNKLDYRSDRWRYNSFVGLLHTKPFMAKLHLSTPIQTQRFPKETSRSANTSGN